MYSFSMLRPNLLLRRLAYNNSKYSEDSTSLEILSRTVSSIEQQAWASLL